MALLRSFAMAAGFLALWLWVVPFYVLRIPPALPDSTPMLALGILLMSLGAALALTCVFDFGRHGDGTPAPVAPPKRLVVRGPYRWMRNPMYVGFGTLYLGEAVLLQSYALLALIVVLATIVLVYVVRVEERRLRQTFGDEYARYAATVNRWVPRRPRE